MAQYASLLTCITKSLFDRARRISHTKAGADAKYDMQAFKESKSQVGQRKAARRAIAEMLQRHAALSGDANHTPTEFDTDLMGAETSHTSFFALYQKEACYFWAPGNVVLAVRGDGVRGMDFTKQQDLYRPEGPYNERTGRSHRKGITADASGNVFVRPPSATEQAVQAATNATVLAATNAVMDAVVPMLQKHAQQIADGIEKRRSQGEQINQLNTKVLALEAQNTTLKSQINLSEHSKAVQSRVAQTMSTLGIQPKQTPQPAPARVLKPRADISPEEAAETSKGYLERLPEAPWEIEYISDDMLYLIPAEIAHPIPKERAHFGQVPMYARAEAFAPTQETYDIDPKYAHLPIGPALDTPLPATVPVPPTLLPQPTQTPAPQSPELAPAFTSMDDIFAFMNETSGQQETQENT